MKLIIQTILILSFPTLIFGQNLNDSLLSTFYNKTIETYFLDSLIINKDNNYKYIIVETDFDKTLLIQKVNNLNFKYKDSTMSLNSILDKPLKKNNGRDVYRIKHSFLGKDTIDLNISGYTIGPIIKKKIWKAQWCGGTMGYIPTGRFVYSKEDNNWRFISRDEIINQKLKEEELLYKKINKH